MFDLAWIYNVWKSWEGNTMYFGMWNQSVSRRDLRLVPEGRFNMGPEEGKKSALTLGSFQFIERDFPFLSSLTNNYPANAPSFDSECNRRRRPTQEVLLIYYLSVLSLHVDSSFAVRFP